MVTVRSTGYSVLTGTAAVAGRCTQGDVIQGIPGHVLPGHASLYYQAMHPCTGHASLYRPCIPVPAMHPFTGLIVPVLASSSLYWPHRPGLSVPGLALVSVSQAWLWSQCPGSGLSVLVLSVISVVIRHSERRLRHYSRFRV